MTIQDFLHLPEARVLLVEVTIANGGHTSAAVDLAGYRVAGIRMPAAWTAAALAISESPDDGTYLPLYDDGAGVSNSEIRLPVAAAISIRLADQLLAPYRYIKLRSVAAADGSTVAQGAERVVTLVCRPAA